MAWTEVNTKPPLKFDEKEDKEKKDKKVLKGEEINLRKELIGLKDVDSEKPITKKPNVQVFDSKKDNK